MERGLIARARARTREDDGEESTRVKRDEATMRGDQIQAEGRRRRGRILEEADERSGVRSGGVGLRGEGGVTEVGLHRVGVDGDGLALEEGVLGLLVRLVAGRRRRRP